MLVREVEVLQHSGESGPGSKDCIWSKDRTVFVKLTLFHFITRELWALKGKCPQLQFHCTPMRRQWSSFSGGQGQVGSLFLIS